MQATPPDSLDQRLAAAPDSARLRLLLADAAYLRPIDPVRTEARAKAARQLAATQHHPALEAEALLLLGRLYNGQGRSPEASQALLAALRQARAATDTLRQAQALLYLGTTYKNQRQFEDARRYARQARPLFAALAQRGHPLAAKGLAFSFNNSGTAYLEQEQYAPAAHDFGEALRQGRALGDSSIAGLALYNLGGIALKTRQGEAAYRYYRQTLAIDEATGNPVGQAESWLNLGDALTLLRRYDEAAHAYGRALPLARQAQAGPLLRVVYDGFASLYETTGRLAEALRWRKRFQSLNDSLYAEEASRQVTEMRTRYETEQQALQNRVQAAQLRNQGLLLRRRTLQLGGGLVLALLLGLVSWLLYNRQSLRQQVARQLERRNEEQQRTKAVLDAEEKERRRIGSDLHDGIGQLLATAHLNLVRLDQQAGARVAEYRPLLQNALAVVSESCQEVRAISHNLMPGVLTHQGLVAALRELLSRLPEQGQLHAAVEAVNLSSRLEPTTEIVLFRVLQELVQNTIKHARATQLHIQLVQHEQELTVVVTDNGIGFTPDRSTTGLGLRNVRARLAYLGGQAHIDSTPGHGSTITLEVPLAAAVPVVVPETGSESVILEPAL